MNWRLSPGTEEGALVPLPAGSETPAAVLRLSRPLAGFHLAAEPVRDAAGRDRLLLRLAAPAGARPGRYDGLLTVRRGSAVTRQPAAVELLPFELMRPSKQYAVTRVPVSSSEWSPPEATDAAALRPLHDLGIGALCLSASPVDRMAVEDAMRAAGMHGPVLAPVQGTEPGTGVTRAEPRGSNGQNPPEGGSRTSGELPALSNDLLTRGAPEGNSTTSGGHAVGGATEHLSSPSYAIHWYSYCTELPAAGEMAALRANGGRVACWVQNQADDSGVDLPIFDAGGAAGERLRRGESAPPAGAPGWWRWDAGAATPLENRLRSGAWLWKSGLSGALVAIGPQAPADPGWPLRWEGVRQGIQDSRYLTTLFSLIRQVKDKDRRSPLPGQAQTAVATALDGLAEHSSAAAADQMRSRVIAWILRLGQLVWSG